MSAPISFLKTVFYAAILSLNDGGNALLEQLNSRSAPFSLTGLPQNIMIENSLFQQVPLDTNEQTACSPEDPGINWRGVLIRAPSRIILPDKNFDYSALVIPICGLYLVDVAQTFRNPGPKMLVVVDNTSGQTYRGALIKRVAEPTVPPPQSKRINPSTKASFGGYFNVNVAAYVELPRQTARYRLKIEYAGYQSNEVDIAVVEHP